MMKIFFRANHISLIIFLLLSCFATDVLGQSNLEIFGQNRVQHRKFRWKYYDTKHFRIYNYDRAGRELARYVAEQAENDIKVIERKLGGEFPRRFNIVLFNSYDEYMQRNIGRKFDSQLQDIPAGTLDIVGDKLVVYFTGEHADIRRQIRKGVSRVVMNRMLFGDNLREMVRNAVLVNLPEWTVFGFISYLVDGWDTKSNSEWKNMLRMYPDKGFYELAEIDPELAGKAFWKYVSDRYGEHTMKNVVYTMQLKSSLKQGIKLTLGQDVKQAYDSAVAFYNKVYEEDEVGRQKINKNVFVEVDVPDDGTILRDLIVAPHGGDVAYVTWKDGVYKVIIQKATKEKVASVILEGGVKDFNEQPDQDYPLISWSSTGYKLAIVYRTKKETRLRIYNSIKARIENYVIPANRFDRLLNMTFMEDDNKLIFSAIKKSQTDLYEFTIRGKRMTNITDDAWDDIEPWYVSGGSRKGVLFLSNRTTANVDAPIAVNELPNGPMNIFFYNTTTGSKELVQMTHVKKGKISQPIQYGVENYAYLYDNNGVKNQYVISVKTKDGEELVTTQPVSNFASNVVTHQYSPGPNKVAFMIRDGGKYKVFYEPLNIPEENAEPLELKPTRLFSSEQKKNSSVLNIKKKKIEEVKETHVLRSGNIFQSEFEGEEQVKKSVKKEEEVYEEEEEEEVEDNEDDIIVANGPDSTYLKMRAKPYKLAFKPDFFTVRLDNSVLFNKYQPTGANANTFNNPSLGGMITVSLDDVMEDYRVIGGFRLPINFSGTSYFLQYENYKRRVDWSILYLRTQGLRNDSVVYYDLSGTPLFARDQIGKASTDLIQGYASYPLDRRRSIRMQFGVRHDAYHYKAEDTLSLSYDREPPRQYWLLSRTEFVFDNTVSPTMNIHKGIRYKVYAEYFYRLNGNAGGLYNIGVDARYYKKIYKNFTWATRGALGHSGGEQILYFVGGVDNWLGAKNNQTPIRPGEQYAFQTIGTNLRGYEQNSFNGNSYGVINTELRLPILTTFLKKPIQSPMLRHLQFVAFFDLGSAWAGVWPNGENVANDINLSNQNVNIMVDDNTGGFGVGYGAGLRTMLFGYFLRLDSGWNIHKNNEKPLLHFSIGTDF